MPAEIIVGSVLGGRYLVTAEVVATAEGDIVFDGTDQILNRPVSLLVAAPANATRVAVNAREIAMGTRPSNVQVLDLGLNGDATYLIANMIDAADLLDLVVEADAPYIEPFQTDTLGQQIFGEPRSLEPQVYDDDAEYYQELAEEQQRKPRLGGLFGRRHSADDEASSAEQLSSPDTEQTPLSPSSAGAAAPATGPFAAAPEAASAAAQARIPSDDATNDDGVIPPVMPLASPLEGTAPVDAEATRPAVRFPREALGDAAATLPSAEAPEATAARVAATADDVLARVPSGPAEGRDTNRWTRVIVGLVLLLVLIGGVVFAVQNLTHRGGSAPLAAPRTSATPSDDASSSAEASTDAPTPSATHVAPKVTGVSLVAPGKDQLSNVYDSSTNQPKNVIDGKSSTRFATYSYTSAQFGGFYSSLTLRLDLADTSDISSVSLTGLAATGGDVQVLIGDDENLDKASEVWSGSLSGATLDVPTLKGDTPAQGRYVFVTVSELPKLVSPTSGSRPYGFQLADVKVS